MNEEQAVLNFFAQPENLPLGLSVAEQMDQIREQMNSRYWQELLQRFDALIAEHELPWRTAPTEDKNAPDTLVGLHCTLNTEQAIYLRPMIEQQYMGGAWRIYYGLMWSATPSPEQLALPAVLALKQALQEAGFKNNESFLAWQWTALHPRRKDFLLRYAQHPDTTLNDTLAMLEKLLITHRATIVQANAALQTAPRSVAISLDQLRGKRS
ncbi:MAG TPA: hypothetical protein VFW53_08485 [Gallionella sp.]|nr:hypothetical protein [Gallionella sp.]